MWHVGTRYTLPSLRLGYRFRNKDGRKITMADYHGLTGWLPLVTPFSYDEEFFNVDFDGAHAHIAWQFVPQWFLDKILAREVHRHRAWTDEYPEHFLLGHVVVLPDRHKDVYVIQPKRHVCLRPALRMATWHPGRTEWIQPLRDKFACAALANGRCPHKGTPEAAFFTLPDGTRVCPAHGLRFNRQGEPVQVPRT